MGTLLSHSSLYVVLSIYLYLQLLPSVKCGFRKNLKQEHFPRNFQNAVGIEL